MCMPVATAIVVRLQQYFLSVSIAITEFCLQTNLSTIVKMVNYAFMVIRVLVPSWGAVVDFIGEPNSC